VEGIIGLALFIAAAAALSVVPAARRRTGRSCNLYLPSSPPRTITQRTSPRDAIAPPSGEASAAVYLAVAMSSTCASCTVNQRRASAILKRAPLLRRRPKDAPPRLVRHHREIRRLPCHPHLLYHQRDSDAALLLYFLLAATLERQQQRIQVYPPSLLFVIQICPPQSMHGCCLTVPYLSFVCRMQWALLGYTFVDYRVHDVLEFYK
jgi:hypothetical protein